MTVPPRADSPGRLAGAVHNCRERSSISSRALRMSSNGNCAQRWSCSRQASSNVVRHPSPPAGSYAYSGIILQPHVQVRAVEVVPFSSSPQPAQHGYGGFAEAGRDLHEQPWAARLPPHPCPLPPGERGSSCSPHPSLSRQGREDHRAVPHLSPLPHGARVPKIDGGHGRKGLGMDRACDRSLP